MEPATQTFDQHAGTDSSNDTAALVRRLEAARGALCSRCGQPLCSHQVLASIVLGVSTAPRCLDCLAQVLEEERLALAQRLFEYFQGRPCFWGAWDWASVLEGVRPEVIPECFVDARGAERPSRRAPPGNEHE